MGHTARERNVLTLLAALAEDAALRADGDLDGVMGVGRNDAERAADQRNLAPRLVAHERFEQCDRLARPVRKLGARDFVAAAELGHALRDETCLE